MVTSLARSPSDRDRATNQRHGTAGRVERSAPEDRIGSNLAAATTARSIAVLQRSIGNASVAAWLAADHGATAAVQRDAAKGATPGVLVHPSSGLSAQQIVRMLKQNKNVPDFLKKSLTVRNGSIALTKPLPVKPEGTFSDFLQPYIDALTSSDWEITTAASTIDVTGTGAGQKFTQIVKPDLAKSEHLGSTHKTGPDGETEFMPDTLFSTSQEVIFGITLHADDTEQLKTKRGLMVIVTRITVTAPDGRKRTFTPSEDEVLESVIHEISAHAGRATENQSDTHGSLPVDQIADEVAEFFRSSSKPGDPTPHKTFDAIADFLGMKAGAAPPPVPKAPTAP